MAKAKNVLVDTMVWSLAFRKKIKTNEEQTLIEILNVLIELQQAHMIGAIRQEILSGISHKEQFDKLKIRLNFIKDLEVTTKHHEQAALFSNLCRQNGVQGSPVDFLICSVAVDYGLSIFTTDKDFVYYAKFIPIQLYKYNKEHL